MGGFEVLNIRGQVPLSLCWYCRSPAQQVIAQLSQHCTGTRLVKCCMHSQCVLLRVSPLMGAQWIFGGAAPPQTRLWEYLHVQFLLFRSPSDFSLIIIQQISVYLLRSQARTEGELFPGGQYDPLHCLGTHDKYAQHKSTKREWSGASAESDNTIIAMTQFPTRYPFCGFIPIGTTLVFRTFPW